jgi:hypothetical protein
MKAILPVLVSVNATEIVASEAQSVNLFKTVLYEKLCLSYKEENLLMQLL